MKPYALLIALILFHAHSLAAAENALTPLKLIQYKGQELALYDGGKLAPERRPPPKYPPAARSRMEEGEVILVAIVNERGEVEATATESCEGDASFAVAAKACVFQWHYKPMLKDSKPAPFAVRVKIAFKITVD